MTNTYIEPEERAYSARGSQLRKGRAVWPDGKVRAVRAGIPDTFFTIPAHGRLNGKYVAGYLTSDENVLKFHPLKKYGLATS